MEGPSDGFTLLEVLVALTILSISLGVLLGVFGQSLDRTATQRQRLAELMLAQSLLAKAQSDPALSPGEQRGQSGDLDWQLRVVPEGDQPLASPVLARIWVEVTLAGNHPFALTTLKLIPKEQGS